MRSQGTAARLGLARGRRLAPGSASKGRYGVSQRQRRSLSVRGKPALHPGGALRLPLGVGCRGVRCVYDMCSLFASVGLGNRLTRGVFSPSGGGTYDICVCLCWRSLARSAFLSLSLSVHSRVLPASCWGSARSAAATGVYTSHQSGPARGSVVHMAIVCLSADESGQGGSQAHRVRRQSWFALLQRCWWHAGRRLDAPSMRPDNFFSRVGVSPSRLRSSLDAASRRTSYC